MTLFKKSLVFNIPIAQVKLNTIAKLITSFINEKSKKTFFYVNAHCINIAMQDKEYLDILQKAELVYSGGYGPVLASKILGDPLQERTPTPDFIDRIFIEAKSKKWSFYFIGSRKNSLEKAVIILRTKYPYIDIKGYHDGYFSEEEELALIQDINIKKPTILIVGMGTPKQEKWIAKNMAQLDAKIFWAVGAMFDVISGTLPRAPKWIQNLRMEWLYRLYQEPTRLWRRYTLGNIEFIIHILKERFRTWRVGYLFVLIVSTQIIIISYLFFSLYQKYHSTPLETSVYPIRTNDYIFSPSYQTKFFYEPKANWDRVDQISWLSKPVTYHLNNEGFNSPVDFLIDKPANTFRIIVLGDSNIFGLYVSPSQNLPSQLQNILQNYSCNNKKIEIINLGVPGYDLSYSMERFIKRGLKYSPDLVIWLIKYDDVFQINDYIKEKAEKYKQEMETNGELKKAEARGEFYPYQSKAQQELVNELGNEKILTRQKNNLEYFDSFYHGRLLIYSYPFQNTTYAPLLESFQKKRPLTYFFKDLPELDDNTQKLPDRHPNPAGYKFIATQLFKYIQTNQVIQCTPN